MTFTPERTEWPEHSLSDYQPSPEHIAIKCINLTKRYGEVTAIDNLNLHVPRGEFFGFLGPNGAGKSTTIKILAGLSRPTSGRAMVAGQDVEENPLGVKSVVGLLPEEINTYDRLSGREILIFTGRIYGLSRAEASRRTEELLNLLEIAQTDSGRLLFEYSMGMRKKIALGCALIHAPKVLLLDEPFNGLDPLTSRSIRLVLQEATRKGVTVFFSSHVMETVERLCTQAAILNKGRLVACGPISSLRQAADAGDETLEDIFVRLVGREGEEVELDWMA